MSEYEKTTTPNMVIDKATGAVLNNDLGAYQAIKKARDEKRKQVETVSKLDLIAKSVDDMTRRIETLEALLEQELANKPTTGDNRD